MIKNAITVSLAQAIFRLPAKSASFAQELYTVFLEWPAWLMMHAVIRDSEVVIHTPTVSRFPAA